MCIMCKVCHTWQCHCGLSMSICLKSSLQLLYPHCSSCLQLHQRLAFKTITTIRRAFDLATGYSPDKMTEVKWLQRIIFLESVAGVPGMVSRRVGVPWLSRQ